MEAVEALALVAGHVDEELLLRNEYLADVTGNQGEGFNSFHVGEGSLKLLPELARPLVNQKSPAPHTASATGTK